MTDLINLTIDMPARDGSYRIRWEQTTRPVKGPVLLDRTPLAHEPGGKSWGGYAGLSLRASQYLSDVTVINSAGVKGRAAHRKNADWMMLTGVINGRPAAVTFFSHPGNERHPPPWFVELQPHQPFWYMNPAFLHDGSFELQPDRPLRLTYLVRVDSQRPDATELEAEYERFAASPHHENED